MIFNTSAINGIIDFLKPNHVCFHGVNSLFGHVLIILTLLTIMQELYE